MLFRSYETNDYFQDKNQKFRGTDFYIDTKILLRGLGFSWKLEVESTKELLQLIKDEYSGNICVFEHTIGELEAALFNASISLKQGKEIDDLELRLCAALNKYNDYDFELFSKGIRSKIEDELDYRIQPAISWHDKNVHDYNIDWNSILEYIQTNHPNWKNRAITNDVNSINSINILRKGDYSKKFGGKNKLPIFVTSNTPLISDIRKYAALFEFDKDQISWNVNSLPIISDYMLICRLWLPKSKTLVSIPTLTLARNAYAAQEGNTIFYSKLKEAAVDMGLKHNVNILDLSELRKGKIEEILVKNTLGNFEDITTEVIANSIDELIAFETINLKSSIDKLEGVNSDNTLMIDKQRQQIIVSACERYKNKLGIGVIKIKLAEIWWIINTVIFGLLLVLFNYIKDANYLTNLKTGSIIIVVITILIKILEKYFARINITNYLLRLSVSSVWKQYSNSVKSTLVGLETNFEKEIIASCLENTIIFNKYIDYCVIES